MSFESEVYHAKFTYNVKGNQPGNIPDDIQGGEGVTISGTKINSASMPTN